MFNVGAPELLVILLVALIVLGPDKLPEAARKVGRFAGEVRRMSAGFQDELRDALQEPVNTDAPPRRSDPVPKAPPPPVKPVSQELPGEAAAADPSSASPGLTDDAARSDDADDARGAPPVGTAGATGQAPPVDVEGLGAGSAGTADGDRSEADAR